VDISCVLLHKILAEQNIEVYSKLKLVFLDSAYSSLYAVIGKHYEKYGELPSFDTLDALLRDGPIISILAIVRMLEVPDVSIEVILDALIDQYTQNETIKLLEPFIDNLPLYDSAEVKNNLAEMVLALEDKTHTSETVFTMRDLMVFQRQEDVDRERINLGLNHAFDAAIGGLARQEVLYIGGMRGSGKSLVSSNIFTNQYRAGNTSLYLSIEMTAAEVHQRHMAMLSGVNLQALKNNKLSNEDILAMARTRVDMFVDAQEVLDDFLEHKDKFKFEETLVRNYELKQDNQMIIVDDKDLTLGAIDLQIGKAKARFGNKLTVVIIDYINQISLGGEQYDWKPQMELSKKLKNIARKHEIALVSPYQIDKTGEARFSKGILDSADISLIIEAHDDCISFDSTKLRGAPQISFTCPVDWSTLTISPQSIDKPTKGAKASGVTLEKGGEGVNDLQWNS